jgi:guanine nucleotide-binding protein G(t) subunit alpha 3
VGKLDAASSMLSIVIENMGLLCSRNRHYNGADTEENAQVSSFSP